MIAVLTDKQLDIITNNSSCPDCQKGLLLLGPAMWNMTPRGEHPTILNIRCDNPGCGNEFHVSLLRGIAISGVRLAQDEPSLYRKKYLVNSNKLN